MLSYVWVQLETLNDLRFTAIEWTRFVEEYLDPANENGTDKARKVPQRIHS